MGFGGWGRGRSKKERCRDGGCESPTKRTRSNLRNSFSRRFQKYPSLDSDSGTNVNAPPTPIHSSPPPRLDGVLSSASVRDDPVVQTSDHFRPDTSPSAPLYPPDMSLGKHGGAQHMSIPQGPLGSSLRNESGGDSRVPKRSQGDCRPCSTDRAPAFQSGLISVLHKLQDTFASLVDGSMDIQLPQVAVVGGQSSGKSSVLESLVGRDFLPRNKDICTRRPLVLHLVRITTPGSFEEHAEFLHRPGEYFRDFNAVRDEIVAETERETGSRCQVSDKPIYLKIFSPYVFPMTLVDLPGISRVPVGDQPDNIEEILSRITMKYVEQEATIILAVTAANSDITNSDALKIAQKIDPTGSRTLGVLTKLDIMDDGTDVRDYLTGQKDPKLRLGYVGMVNRSQASIERNKPVAQALCEEEEWFATNRKSKAYRDIYNSCCGTRRLAKKVNRLLGEHVRNNLSVLRASVRSQLRSVEGRLEAHGNFDPSSRDEQAEVIARVLSAFEREFKGLISGDVGEPLDHLYGGARILNQLRIFKEHMAVSIANTSTYSDEELFHTIQNVYGVEGHVLMAEKAFRRLVPSAIKMLEKPCVQCAQAVFEELQGLLDDALVRVHLLQRFPVLKARLRDIADAVLHDAMRPTLEMIKNIINMEKGYINTDHPGFLGGEKAAEKAAELMDAKGKGAGAEPVKEMFKYVSSSKMEEVEMVPRQGDVVKLKMQDRDLYPVQITRVLLESYGSVVCQNLQDYIPKTILHFLVNGVCKQGINQALSRHLNRSEMFDEMLVEHSGIEKERQELRAKRKAYRQALSILDEVPTELSSC